MSLFQPGVLWDIGFQLSFAATLGLILYADPFLESFNTLAGEILPPDRVKRLAGPVGGYLLFTLAAQVTTLPLILHYTGVLSLSALLANPLVLPVQPPLMILGGIATLVGLISFTLGQWIAYLAWPFLAFTIRAVEWLAGMPGGVLYLGSMGAKTLLLYYATLFGWSLWRWLKARQAEQESAQPGSSLPEEKPALLERSVEYLRLRPWLPLMTLGVLTLVAWRGAESSPDGILHITILNVGSGEAILIRTPGGRSLLINGGPSGLALADALGRRLPPAQRQFDWWVIANGDEEAVTALPPILDRYPPDQVIWAGPSHGTYASRNLWEALTVANLPVTTAQTGQVLELDGGGSLQMLEVGSRGATLLLDWGEFSLLLPIGMNFEAMEHLQPQIQPVTALLLAESGYAPLNPDKWLEALDPQFVLLSVAADDRQRLPDQEVLASLEGYTLLRTDQNGWIELSTDGKQMWVEAERR
jgi:competence protein ComEC